MSGHTPGPWRWNARTNSVVSNQSHPVAYLSEPVHRMLFDRTTGNDGPLIAAAPDLLQVARELLEEYEGDAYHASRDLIERAHAVIAKATTPQTRDGG